MLSIVKKMFAVVSAVTIVTAFTACENSVNPELDGIKGPTLELNTNYFILSMVFENVQLEGGLSLPLQEYPNSSISVGPDFESGGMLLQLNFSMLDIAEEGFKLLDPKTLPGGRPLPGVASGQLPALTIIVPQLNNTVFYVGPKVFGIFTPTPDLSSGSGAILTFTFYDNNHKRAGNISVVGADNNGANSGVLVLVNLKLFESQLNAVTRQ